MSRIGGTYMLLQSNSHGMRYDLNEWLSNPEYTGENRCIPCTAVNLVLGAVLGLLVARHSVAAGTAVAGLAAGLVYLRGYLVPGTPELTKRYLPDRVLRLFGKEPVVATGFAGSVGSDSAVNVSAGGDTGSDSATGSNEPAPTADLDAYLQSTGVLEPCRDGDLCLTDEFESAWLEVARDLDEDALPTRLVAETFGIEAEETAELVSRGEARLFRTDDGQLGQWPSRAALVADVAAGRVLQSWLLDWPDLGPETRSRMLTGVRVFLETCPTADGGVETGVDVVESCCSSQSVYAVTCTETGDRLLEYPISDI